MVRQTLTFFSKLLAAFILAMNFLFWCALGAIPVGIVFAWIGMPLMGAFLIGFIIGGVPFATYVMSRKYGTSTQAPTPAPAHEPEPEAPAVESPPAKRSFTAAFDELDAQEAHHLACLEAIRERRRALEEATERPDAEKLAAILEDRSS